MGDAEALVRFFHDIDRRDWPAVRAAMADELMTDYTELGEVEPEFVDADTLVERWQGLLPGFDATQHLLGPVVPTASGRAGEYECNVHATHRLDGAEWVVAGGYTLTVTAGKLAGITLHVSWLAGDTSLADRAAERARG